MTKRFYIEYPKNYSFYHTARSHGWYSLAPFEFDESEVRLSYVFSSSRGPSRIAVADADGRLLVETDGTADRAEAEKAVKSMLRLDEPMDHFYGLAAANGLDWVVAKKAGRLLRSPTVWEDLVKTICTTNCSWALTRSMVANLVEKLGEPGADGRRAFPAADAMADVDEAFYRTEIRAGYRSTFFVELAQKTAAGEIDPESWASTDLPTVELKKLMKSVKGVGDYAAENLLKLVGRYDGLALDSWLRAQYYKRHNSGEKCPDKQIVNHYDRYGEWRGLAIWCDMTERWFDQA
jgi:3-methyladenine DNA glycosylase/8-oxoguanine DNA glycosylase